MRLNSQTCTNHRSKAAVSVNVPGESISPKSETKSYPSTCAAEGTPAPRELPGPGSLQTPLGTGQGKERSLRPSPGAWRGITVPNQGKRFPTLTAPLSAPRGLTGVEAAVPSASKALRTMSPPDTGHRTNPDSLVQKKKGEKKNQNWFSTSLKCHGAFEDGLKHISAPPALGL